MIFQALTSKVRHLNLSRRKKIGFFLSFWKKKLTNGKCDFNPVLLMVALSLKNFISMINFFSPKEGNSSSHAQCWSLKYLHIFKLGETKTSDSMHFCWQPCTLRRIKSTPSKLFDSHTGTIILTDIIFKKLRQKASKLSYVKPCH